MYEMHIRNLDLNLLVVMDAMLRERNVSKAAAILGVSRETLHNKIRKYEIEVQSYRKK